MILIDFVNFLKSLFKSLFLVVSQSKLSPSYLCSLSFWYIDEIDNGSLHDMNLYRIHNLFHNNLIGLLKTHLSSIHAADKLFKVKNIINKTKDLFMGLIRKSMSGIYIACINCDYH